MAVLTLISTSAASATSSTFNIRDGAGISAAETGLAQIEIGTSATVSIQGRLSSAYSWYTVHQTTTDDAVEIPLFPEMRVVIADGSGTTVVGLLVPEKF